MFINTWLIRKKIVMFTVDIKKTLANLMNDSDFYSEFGVDAKVLPEFKSAIKEFLLQEKGYDVSDAISEIKERKSYDKNFMPDNVFFKGDLASLKDFDVVVANGNLAKDALVALIMDGAYSNLTAELNTEDKFGIDEDKALQLLGAMIYHAIVISKAALNIAYN